MAIEDIIWAKNRHMFGGIAPSNMITFEAKLDSSDETKVVITAQPPEKTVVDGQTVCTVGGFVIRKKSDGYPVNEFDGELVINHAGSDTLTYVDTIEAGIPTYYAAFPYSKQGVYNRNTKNRAAVNDTVAPRGTYLFGYDMDLADENPETRVSYPVDVDNYGWEPASIVSSSSLNDWNFEPGEYFMPKPCMVYCGWDETNGSIAYYLNPKNYAETVDGEESNITSISTSWNAMMEWPKIYTKRWEEDGIYHFRCSDVKIDDDYECWCNYDVNDNEIDHFYTGIYPSVYSNSIGNYFRSISGITPICDHSFTNERNFSRANGDGWDIECIADHFLIQDLLVMMGKSTDVQEVFGCGIANLLSSSPSGANGTLNAKSENNGLFYGSSNSTVEIKVFGMENYWGDRGRRMNGLFLYNGSYYIKITKGNMDGTTATDFTVADGSGYIKDDFVFNEGTVDYVSEMKTFSWGRLPISFGGTSSSYECDACSVYNNNTYRPVIVGGNYGETNPYIGPFRYDFGSLADNGAVTRASRLSYKPTASTT